MIRPIVIHTNICKNPSPPQGRSNQILRLTPRENNFALFGGGRPPSYRLRGRPRYAEPHSPNLPQLEAWVPKIFFRFYVQGPSSLLAPSGLSEHACMSPKADNATGSLFAQKFLRSHGCPLTPPSTRYPVTHSLFIRPRYHLSA